METLYTQKVMEAEAAVKPKPLSEMSMYDFSNQTLTSSENTAY